MNYGTQIDNRQLTPGGDILPSLITYFRKRRDFLLFVRIMHYNIHNLNRCSNSISPGFGFFNAAFSRYQRLGPFLGLSSAQSSLCTHVAYSSDSRFSQFINRHIASVAHFGNFDELKFGTNG